MLKEKLLKYIIILMVLMFLANELTFKFHLQYSIWWLDIPLHFFGGVWVGLFFLYVFYQKNYLLKDVAGVLLCVLCIGIFWEVFEYIVFNRIGGDSFNLTDTLSDIGFDILGGFCAILYLWKKQDIRQPK